MATYRSGFVKQGSRSDFYVEDADTKQKRSLQRSRHHLMLLLMPPSPFLTVSKKSQGTNLPWLFFSYAYSSFLSGMEGFFTSPSPNCLYVWIIRITAMKNVKTSESGME